LCRGLSPRCLSLFNILGAQKAPFLLLAPCCVPTSHVKQVLVSIYESDDERALRLQIEAQRNRVTRNNTCYVCGVTGHRVPDCPALPANLEERDRVIREATAAQPCWKCGEVGHRKSDCPSKQTANRPPRPIRASVTLNLTAVHAARKVKKKKVNPRHASTEQPLSALEGLMIGSPVENGKLEGASIDGASIDGAPGMRSTDGPSDGGALRDGTSSEMDGISSNGEPARNSSLPVSSTASQVPKKTPFEMWMEALRDAAEGPTEGKQVVVVPLSGLASYGRDLDERNWNRDRKCSWLVVAR